jgi:hypothetical protein
MEHIVWNSALLMEHIVWNSAPLNEYPYKKVDKYPSIHLSVWEVGKHLLWAVWIRVAPILCASHARLALL